MRRDSKRGSLFIISAPAGTGKTTLVNRLKTELPYVRETISCTTRAPRRGEQDGRDYFFLSRDQFEGSLEKGAFLEWVDLYGDYYGTLREQVESLQQAGYQVILVIDTQGAIRLKEKVEASLVFISPPSMRELRRRLSLRASESPEAIERRLRWAEYELEQLHHYDYHIVNDDLESAYLQLRQIIERCDRLTDSPTF